jgi:hypothetical protein
MIQLPEPLLGGPGSDADRAGIGERHEDVDQGERGQHEQGEHRARKTAIHDGRGGDRGHHQHPSGHGGEHHRTSDSQCCGGGDAGERDLASTPEHARDGRPLGLPHDEFGGQLDELEHAGCQRGAAPHLDACGEATAQRCQGPGKTSAHRAGQSDHDTGRGQEPRRHGRGDQHDQEPGPDWHPDPQLPVHHRLDVIDDRGQYVAAAATQGARSEGHDCVVHLHPALGQQPQRLVVRAEPLDIAQRGAGQTEGPDAHDRDQHGEHGRVFRGLDDEPASGRGQGGTRERGAGRQQAGDQEPAPDRAVRNGSQVGPSGRLRRAGDRALGHRFGCTGGKGEAHHVVRQSENGRAVRDHHDRTIARQPGQCVGDDALSELIEVCGRFVEEDPRSVGRDDPGQGQSSPLAGREQPSVLADGAVDAVRHGGDPVGQSHFAHGRPHVQVGGLGRSQAYVVGDRAGQEHRPLGEPADLDLPLRPSDVDATNRDPPGPRFHQPHHGGQQGRLAAARRTGHDRQSPIGERRVESIESGRAPIAVHDRQARDGDRARARSRARGARDRLDGTDLLERRPALGRGVELRTHLAQRPVGLRRQQKYDESGPQVEVTGCQTHPDGDRDQRHREGRHQLEHSGGGERDPQRVQGRPAIAVRDLSDGGRLRGRPPERHQRRQPAHHVDEVAGQRGQGPPLLLGPVAGGQPDQRPEDGDQRQRRQLDDRAQDVLGRRRDDREHREHHREQERRQIAGQIGLGGVDTAGGQRRHLTGGPGAIGLAEDTQQQAAPETGPHRGGRTRGVHVDDEARDRPTDEDGDQGQPPPRPVATRQRRDQEPCQHEGLADDQ